MKDFFDLLVQKFGLPEFFASYFMLFFYFTTGFYLVVKTVQTLRRNQIRRFIKKEMDQDLHPYFTHEEIVKYTKYYIPQYFQNITPSEGDELNSMHAAAARSKLMPVFLKKDLLSKSSIKYFIILSDTGMGKTAFLINLYMKYKSLKANKERVLFKIRLFPLGAKDILTHIQAVEDKENTILLLDAFDEDIKAVIDYKARMIEILESVTSFRKVIFTCRTQFFPSRDEEPTDTSDITFGENIKHSIHKLYLSAFDEKDIIKYLFKKYELNLIKLYRAYHLVKKCPSLMFRPMLLTYIDDLLKGRLIYNYSYEMYFEMIDKWVTREALKPAVRSRHTGIYTYEEKLWNFSYDLAINLYNNREKRAGYTISLDELGRLIADKNIDSEMLSIGDSTGRSLLNRNSSGQFKFAHKSILEFLLASKIFRDPDMLSKFDFHGMDAACNFHNEMMAHTLKHCEGTYKTKNQAKPKSLSTIIPSDVRDIYELIIHKMEQFEPEAFAGLANVKKIIYANQSLLPLYITYIYVDLYKRRREKFTDGNIIDGYDEVPKDILQSLKNLDANYIKNILDNCEVEKVLKGKIYDLLSGSGDISLSYLDSIKLQIIAGRSERAVVFEAYSDFKHLKKIQSYLPNVEMYF